MLYILLLEENKLYVGYTADKTGKRIIAHVHGSGGAKWCKKYKPVALLDFREGDLKDEDELTLNLMMIYGYENVRGGKWVRMVLFKPPKKLIELQLAASPLISQFTTSNTPPAVFQDVNINKINNDDYMDIS